MQMPRNVFEANLFISPDALLATIVPYLYRMLPASFSFLA
jgi:hypothetical protein